MPERLNGLRCPGCHKPGPYQHGTFDFTGRVYRCENCGERFSPPPVKTRYLTPREQMLNELLMPLRIWRNMVAYRLRYRILPWLKGLVRRA